MAKSPEVLHGPLERDWTLRAGPTFWERLGKISEEIDLDGESANADLPDVT